MQIVNKLIPQARGLAPSLLRRAALVELPWDMRQKSRFDAVDSAGRALGFMLPRGTVLRGGDVAVLEDGSLVQILAAAQSVLVVRTCTAHGTPRDLLRAAYHLANRHVPLELQADHLKLEPDHVLAAMLRAMHLRVDEEQSAFEPEAGAYGGSHGGPHPGSHAAAGHADPHAHAHDGQRDQTPAAAAAAADAIAVRDELPPHVHGPGCGHGHGGHRH